jgi:DivIVA domain-containing protein
VRDARFSSRRRGFDPEEVLLFLNKLANDIQAAATERAALRAELHRVRAELDRMRHGSPDEQRQDRIEISVHAVGLLSQAQQTADSCVAEAEQYAREMIQAARGQYQDILQRAQLAAENSVRDLAVEQPDRGVSLPEVEHVRTYARVVQVQLSAVLDALTQEVDKLGRIPQVEDYQSGPASGPAPDDEVSWLPNNLVSLTMPRLPGAELSGQVVQPNGGS